MTDSTNSSSQKYDDEIDLIELIRNLWEEKWAIISSMALVTLIGTVYAVAIATPIYKASTQLMPPTQAELSYLNQTEFFNITPELVFAEFLSTLESNDHIQKLIANHEPSIESALENHTNTFTLISKIRKIDYPNTSKKTNSITPDKYFISLQGINRDNLIKLIQTDLDTAKETAINRILSRYTTTLKLQIQRIEETHELKQKVLDDQLEARKAFVLSSRKNNLRNLEEALKIAKALNLKSPSSLARLAASDVPRQVEINAELNNNKDPLYLRGTKLLNAEIVNLKNIEDDIFLDNEILKMETEKLLLKNNRPLEQLKTIYSEIDAISNNNVEFYSQNINSSTKPIKPRKTLIITISIFLGSFLGLCIAIGRIVYRNTQNSLP